jgi:hypothetical protein
VHQQWRDRSDDALGRSVSTTAQQFTFERLGLSRAPERISSRFFHQPQQFFGSLGVHLDPILKILEGLRFKFQAHVSHPQWI